MIRALRLSFALGCLVWLGLMPAHAEFAVLATPPRFEVKAAPGDRVRQVLELTSVSETPSVVTVKTADWSLRPDLSLDFTDELQPGSCRPWVAIERREVTLTPNRPYRYRFEVEVPKGQPPGECRFALMVEGRDATRAGPGSSIPLGGRLGIIVYVAVGSAEPALKLREHRVVRTTDGATQLLLEVHNEGTAHGRLEGFLRGTDAAGTSYDVIPAASPVLAGETRSIALIPTRPGRPDQVVTPVLPLRVSGKLEIGGRSTEELDRQFTAP